MLNANEKAAICKKFGRSETDTGSTEVQIALLTARINQLMTHFNEHKHDNNAKRGFLKIIGQRRKYLRYLKSEDAQKYSVLIKELGIRK